MARLRGFGLSSHFVRCRAADSLAFVSVRLFESCKYALVAYLPHPGFATISIILIVLARLRGFEPPIFGFVVRCSIQLSYRRTIFHGGEGGIRTPGRYKPSTVFKTVAFSQTLPPLQSKYYSAYNYFLGCFTKSKKPEKIL